MDQQAAGAVCISGNAFAFFAFDIGFQVDLEAAERLVDASKRFRIVRSRRPAPVWFDYSPAPLAVAIDGESLSAGGRAFEPTVQILVYDFGAAILTYRTALPETLSDLPEFSGALYDQALFEADARKRIARVMDAVRPAIERPRLSDAVEDYLVFSVTSWDESLSPISLADSHRSILARTIESEPAALAEEQIRRSLQGAMSYSTNDLAIIDWNAALLFDREPDDVIAVLQHANVELLELRVLDDELDAILDHADETLASMVRARLWPSFSARRILGRIASAQTDAAVSFEGVNNAIKLMGNQYLARLYRLAAARLDLPSWHGSVIRKLEATDNLYHKMSDAASTRRLETLEWVIIVLIGVSILLPFTPWYH